MNENNLYDGNISDGSTDVNSSYDNNNYGSNISEIDTKENKSKKPIAIVSISLLLILVIISLLLVNLKSYTVKFVNGDNIYTRTVKRNHVVKRPIDPKKEGYNFIGWYLNGKKYNFDSKVKDNFTLKAKFEKTNELEIKKDVSEVEQTTTVTTTTTKKDDKTTTKKKTTIKNSSNNGFSNYPTTTVAPATTRPPQTAPATTTTMAVTYSVRRIPIATSTIGQERIYIVNNSTGAYVNGTATVTYNDGHSETTSIPASGKVVVGSTVTSVSNPKGN